MDYTNLWGVGLKSQFSRLISREKPEKKKSLFFFISLILATFLLPTPTLHAADYYVSPTGSVTWGNCTNINTPCSLDIANKNAVAGDTINMRGGTYNINISPANSGTGVNSKIIYQRYNNETPLITNTGTDILKQNAIYINGKNYIKIDGITIRNVHRIGVITNGSNYNEIVNCDLSHATTIANGGLSITSNGITLETANTHNWIHNNSIYDAGVVTPIDDQLPCNDQSNLMKIGSSLDDGYSNYNTVENNHMYHGGHHVLAVNSQYNVIRNNFMHNEEFMDAPSGCNEIKSAVAGKYGNRVLILVNYIPRGTELGQYIDPLDLDSYTLVENNRIGKTGLPSDDDGSDGLTLGTNHAIVRYNTIYDSKATGVYFRSSNNPSDYIHFYNNSLYNNGINTPDRQIPNSGWVEFGIRVGGGSDFNELVNNIVYDGSAENIDCQGTCTSNIRNNWVTTNGDPLFVNTDTSDPLSQTSPDFSLQPNSKVIDKGTHLTTVAGADSGFGTTLIVNDAWYFQDGTWGSALASLDADWISVGDVTNSVQIASIDYKNNKITLTKPISRKDNDPIYLFKDSNGNHALQGSAPDIGASEYGSGVLPIPLLVGNSLESVVTYPNPWRSDTHGTQSITFDSLPLNTTIKIFTIAGEHVVTLPILNERNTWDLKDKSGDDVASGVYTYVISTEEGDNQRGQIAVVR